MKAFLFYGYSLKNAGDMAITLGAIDLLISKGYNVDILSRYDKDDSEFTSSSKYLYSRYKDKIKVFPCPFKLNRSASKIKLLTDYFNNLLILLGVIKVKDIEERISSSNLLCFNGGNFFRCESGTDILRLLALDFPMKIARKMNRKYVILPQSASKINKIGRYLLSRIFNGASSIFIREGESYKKLKSIFPRYDFIRTIDLAFHIDNANQLSGEKGEPLNIAITLRAWTVGDIKEFNKLEKEQIANHIQKICDNANNGNPLMINFFVQTKKDKAFTEEIAEKLKLNCDNDIKIIEEYDPVKLIQQYSKMEILIGMRLHSIILAILAGTPCHGIFFKEWGFKNSGLMDDFNLYYFFIDSKDYIYPDFLKLPESKKKFEETSRKIIMKEKKKILNRLTNISGGTEL